MTTEERYAQLEKALAQGGDMYTLADIRGFIEAGHMQSFAKNDTWVVTQIVDFPQKRVLEIFLVTGDLDDAEALYDEVLQFGRERGCQIVRCYGRYGWTRKAREHGWTNGQRIFWKEL
jgi:hypothetical protein